MYLLTRCFVHVAEGLHTSDVIFSSDDPDWNDEGFVLHLNNQNLHDGCVVSVKSARFLRADRLLGSVDIDLEWVIRDCVCVCVCST